VTDGKRSAKQPVQAAGLRSCGDPGFTQTEAAQLPPRDHPVLPLRQACDLVIQVSGAPFAAHV